MADSTKPERSGVLAATNAQYMKARSGDNPAGFNTVFFQKTGGAGTFFIESSPNAVSDPANEVWYNVDGTDSQLTDTGIISFQQRAEMFRVRVATTLTGNWWAV